jgi:hypothetical protein
MIATIQLSPYILVQGVMTRRLPGGAIAVQVGGREVIGAPVNAPPPPARPRLAFSTI